MPLHDYECSECEEKFEVYQKYEEEELTVCENCGSNSLQKIFSVPTFFVSQEAKTLGQIADRNAKKLGRGETEERTLKNKDKTKSAEIQAKKEIYSNINKMNDSQKRKYVDGK